MTSIEHDNDAGLAGFTAAWEQRSIGNFGLTTGGWYSG